MELKGIRKTEFRIDFDLTCLKEVVHYEQKKLKGIKERYYFSIVDIAVGKWSFISRFFDFMNS